MRRLLLLMFWLLELPLLVAGALLLLAWFWSGTDESLATALAQASRYLPADQKLVAQDVRGSLRQGGHIGLLRWEKNGLTLQARQVDLVWRPIALLDRRLQLDNVHVAELAIADRGPPSGDAPLDNLVLPFQIDLAFVVDVLRWAGPPALEATGLSGHYRYDNRNHALKLDSARFAQGTYQAQASMLARAPMKLDLRVQGKLVAPTGISSSIALNATASLSGALAGPKVVLDLSARLQPDKQIPVGAMSAAPGRSQASSQRGPQGEGTTMSADLTAKINPWAAQPVLQGQANFAQLNLAALWKEAPQTALTGTAQVTPQGNNWQARLSLDNRLPGPWDKGRLPVESAKAVVEYAAGRWNIQSLDADAAGGHIQAQARLGDAASLGALSGWQGQAQLRGVNPALIHGQLAPARLDGDLRATAAQEAITFDAALQPSGQQPASSPLQGLRLRSASAKGIWAKGWLQLQNLLVQTDDAKLQGQLDLQPSTRTGRGELQLSVPGAEAKLSGQLGALDGMGDLSLQLADAAKAKHWLNRVPQVPQSWVTADVQGNADLSLHWQGGWQALINGGGTEPTLQLTLIAPRLDLRSKDQEVAQSLHLRDFNAELSGPVSAMELLTSGELRQETRRAQFQAQARGGRNTSGAWQGSVTRLRIQAQDSLYPGPWTLNLQQAISLDWQPAASGGTLSSSAGAADLSGPLPGTATLAWEPLRWSVGTRNELTSKGQLRGLTIAWLDLLGNAQLANMGFTGNMVFDADWDLVATDTLKLRATLARRSGDIRVQTDSVVGATNPGATTTPTIAAGVKDARITVNADGDTLRAALLWDSERAGNAQAEFTTRITHGAAGWDWAADAPLAATVRARLPQVGVWSVLAPPGWRMRGTLDANMALSGTRRQPQWSGSLQADDLGLRSVVDGIEFGNGRLRASVRGQRLEITEFSLQGAGGEAGGELTAKGFAEWLADGTGANPALTKIRIELDATARALRVSARADRRLAVSGTMQARLNNARLNIQGALKADQALFVLPDETAPSLGDDVVVQGATPAATAGNTASTGAAARADSAGTRVSTELSVALDLGPDFRVQGRGITTRLAGTLQLRSAGGANDPPRLTGEVRTVAGSYKAYGQNLDIEQGVLRFAGPYDNPFLDILAIRPNLSQRVGVQITGTALAPRVRLYSEPELAEAEKLAWLVLGRSGANGGAEAAVLQQAALALLGRSGQGLSGGLASRLGLDELSFAGSRINTDGTTTSGATVTLGKRISKNFYVAYERGLAGTLGTFSIFYDLSQRFTLRARTGEQSALDLIFTLSYD